MKKESEKYRQQILVEVAKGKQNNSYSALRKLESFDSKSKYDQFTLPGHADENLSPAQSAERLADYFSEISQELTPIYRENFPHWIQHILMAGKTDQIKPVLEVC